MSDTHALYRFYGEDGALLYIGITNDPGRRFGQHGEEKPWWHEVAEIKMQRYATRDEVLEAERDAIRTEHPRYNIVHNGAAVDRPRRHLKIPGRTRVAFVAPLTGKRIAYVAVSGRLAYDSDALGLTLKLDAEPDGLCQFTWLGIEWLTVDDGTFTLADEWAKMTEQWPTYDPDMHEIREDAPDSRSAKRALADRANHIALMGELDEHFAAREAEWDELEAAGSLPPGESYAEMFPQRVEETRAIFARYGVKA